MILTPREDYSLGFNRGDILVMYQKNKRFQFGKNLSDQELHLIVSTVNEYLGKTNVL
jgi:hypothetical protein